MMKGVHFTFTATNKAAPAMSSFSRGLQNVKQQTDAATKTNTSFMRGMSDNRRAIQNAGFQVGDFAVQLAGGQNAMLAFSQQGGQMLQFFGAFGAVAGAALAIAAAVALSMGAMKDNAKKLSESVDSLTGNLDKYRSFVEQASKSTKELYKDFGEFAGQIKSFSEYMSGVQLATTFDSLKDIITPLKGPLAEVEMLFANVTRAQKALTDAESKGYANAEQILQYREALYGFQDAFESAAGKIGLTGDQALRLNTAIDNLGKATGAGELTAAASNALDVMRELVPKGEELPAPLRESAMALQQIVEAGAEATVALSDMTFGFDDALAAANGVVTATKNIGIAAEGTLGAIKKMAGAMWDAAMARGAATQRLAEMSREFSPGGQAELAYGGRGAPNSAQSNLGKKYDMFGNPIVSGGASTKSAASGGGGTDVLADLQKQLALETELLGKTEAQQRVIQALGADWQSYGDVVINGLTGQIQQIEAFNQKVAEQQNLANTIKSSMENAFMGIVSGTMKAKDAFRQMAASIISELFKVLVVQKLVGSFNSTTGAGSGLMGFIGKALSFDGGGYTGYGARSGGVDGKGGFPAILHPNETVVDHTKGGSGGVTVVQNNTFGSGVTRAEVQSLLPKMVEASKRAVLDAKQRGGRYGQAMA
jgi:hypothetical protein